MCISCGQLYEKAKVFIIYLIFVLLADLYVEKMRFKAVSCMSRSYRPTVPVSYVAQVLGFTGVSPTNEECEERDSDGLEECVEWLKAHGASLVTDANGEVQLDAKVHLIQPYYN